MKLINDVYICIGHNKLSEAIKHLINHVPKENKEVYNEVVLLDRHSSELNKREINNFYTPLKLSEAKENLAKKIIKVLKPIEEYLLFQKDQENHNFQKSDGPFSDFIISGLTIFLLCFTLPLSIYYHEFSSFNLIILSVIIAFLLPKKSQSQETPTSRKFDIILTNQSGVVGGLLGGLITGVIFGIGYYIENQCTTPDDKIKYLIKHIIFLLPFCTATGSLIGLFTVFGMRYFQRIKYINWNVSSILGGFLGFSIAAIPMGILCAYYFADHKLNIASFTLIVVLSFAFSLSFGISLIYYNYKGKFKYIFRVIGFAILIEGFLSLCLYLILGQDFITDIKVGLVHGGLESLIAGGKLGILLCLLCGSTIPICLILYKSFSYSEKQKLEEIKHDPTYTD